MRYTLRDREILQHCLQHPGRGTSYSVRSLASAIGLSHHSLIGHLLTGERTECDRDVAHDIAEAVGVAVLVLFAPPATPDQTGTDRDRTPTTRSLSDTHT